MFGEPAEESYARHEEPIYQRESTQTAQFDPRERLYRS